MTLRVTDFAHELLGPVVRPGAQVLDATVGWGQDTLWLAQRVGTGGKVWGMDAQAKALAHTRALLDAQGVGDQVSLWQGLHGEVTQWCSGPGCVSLDAAILNLGYLPGEREVYCTELDQTKILLRWVFSRMRQGSRMVCCVYPGHAQGEQESQWIAAFAQRFPRKFGPCWRHQFANRGPKCPWIWMVQRTAKDTVQLDWSTWMALPESPCDP